MKLLLRTVERPTGQSARKRTRFPGTAELERLILLDVLVIMALLLVVIFRSL
jgi:hypothetical protein